LGFAYCAAREILLYLWDIGKCEPTASCGFEGDDMKFVDWCIKGFDRRAAVDFVRRGINPLVAVFLSSRGIAEADTAVRFLTDKLDDIYDPFLLRDMDKATERLERALQRGEKIVVYGDYDVDGMTASALLKSYLMGRGCDAEVYIPERGEEGYGLHSLALDCLAQKGAELIVTVDCGITAVCEAKHARKLGVDLIITDHHECKEEIPSACAVVCPKRPDCEYPNKVLAGVGVAFKLVCAMEGRESLPKLLNNYGDLVAIGTIADVMPVTGENRALIRAGLRRLSDNPRPGLLQLLRKSGTTRTRITGAVVGFSLAPRLNAAGRMGRTSLSVDVLLTGDADEADRLTEELCRLNALRRELEGVIFDEVMERLGDTDPKGPIVMTGLNWFQGVMGIVAARTAERRLFPAVMISMDTDGVGRGSCRSFGNFKMYSALKKCGDLLINYGGHEMAAGLTICEENIGEFRRRITEIYHDTIKIPPVPTLRADFEVEKPELLELANVEALEALEPFGNAYLPPCLMLRAARLARVTPVGGGRHTRMRVEKCRRALDCILFGVPAEHLGVREGDLIDIIFEPQVNEFRQRREVQLHVMDIRPNTDA
jgi:single-stranded-DNA-specific exonuclease